MNEYTCLDYKTAKMCYEENIRINIYTGEIDELEIEG